MKLDAKVDWEDFGVNAGGEHALETWPSDHVCYAAVAKKGRGCWRWWVERVCVFDNKDDEMKIIQRGQAPTKEDALKAARRCAARYLARRCKNGGAP